MQPGIWPLVQAVSVSLKNQKRKLRAAMKQIRGSVSNHDRQSAQHAIADHVLSLLGEVSEPCIGGYLAIGGELDCRPALAKLAERGARLAMPVVSGKRQELEFRAWNPATPLEDGPHGTRHPAPPALELQPNILLIPVLAFDQWGNRLGWGGGYYDRTLAALRRQGPITGIGIAFARQRVESLPIDSNDQPLDWIVTENGVNKKGDPTR